ncbi:afln vera monooxygenase [Phlyctema vagabunda]|uniref:Afln vera monooxygenase n=1 Tax=Phlyctema vagabunda TaxID=108571 RepID=A0ABR4PCL7_9HELO
MDTTNNALITTGIVVLSALCYFFYKGYKARLPFRILSAQGVPMPPWNPFLGHLLSLPPVLKLFPEDAQQIFAFGELSKQFTKSDGLFYLDMWPFSDPLLVISSPSQCIQACQQHDLPKPRVMKDFFHPFAGGENLFTMNGPEWKRSRALFNPGFAANYILEQMPHIVEEALVYVDVLREHAKKGDVFSLDDATLWFTMDIIGAVTLNSRLNSQRTYNPLASAMRSQVHWHCMDGELNPFVRWNPVRPVIEWWNGKTMDRYISKELDKRFAERQSAKGQASRSVIDLALESYIADNPSLAAAKTMDKAFKSWAITQIRLFLFAGHDSTSSTIVYCYYLLSKNPEALARIQAEHDAVFGRDISAVPDLLIKQPQLANKLPYTLAVIKEALRLFPPASGIRGGLPGADLTDSHGNSYPTEGMTIWILHTAVQRHAGHWKDPDAFIPDRWLVTDPEDPYYPVKGAWRPFEFGPRNCVGQTLVMLDIKAVLAMTVREFDISDAYQEWDSLNLRKGQKDIGGERAYQISSGGAHPSDGFPCRVRERKL